MSIETLKDMESEKDHNFIFVTTNREKLQTAQRHLEPLGITFKSQSLDLTEIQSDNVEEIAKLKAEEAYKLVHSPLIITDHSWSIPALRGFPGPFMKFINQWLTTEDIQNLVKPYEDKTVIKTEVLCYRDNSGTMVFKNDMSGRILDEPRGDGLPFMRLVSLLPNGTSVAECIEQDIDMSNEYSIWENFANWYKERNVS